MSESNDTTVLTAWDHVNIDSVLRHEYPSLCLSRWEAPRGYVRISSLKPYSTEGMKLDERNAVYYECELVERAPRDDEVNPREKWGAERPESIYEIRFPNVEDLHAALDTCGGDPHGHDVNLTVDGDPVDLSADIHRADTRDRLVKTFQERAERSNYRMSKSHRWKGSPFPGHLEPECRPDHESDDPDDDHDPVRLYERARGEYYSHREAFASATGLDYGTVMEARREYAGPPLYRMDRWDFVALDVLGIDDEAQCHQCGTIWPTEQLLCVDVFPVDDDRERIRQTCDRCARVFDRFREENVALAKDDRAQRLGGQRRLAAFGPTCRKRHQTDADADTDTQEAHK